MAFVEVSKEVREMKSGAAPEPEAKAESAEPTNEQPEQPAPAVAPTEAESRKKFTKSYGAS
jgi:hypothetical protein